MHTYEKSTRFECQKQIVEGHTGVDVVHRILLCERQLILYDPYNLC